MGLERRWKGSPRCNGKDSRALLLRDRAEISGGDDNQFCGGVCVCRQWTVDVTHTGTDQRLSMEPSTPCEQVLRISCLLCNANELVSVCGTPDTQLATEEL